MVAVVQLKRCIAGASIFRIIIGKFSYWKGSYLVVLLKVDKDLEVGFHYAISPLCLAINLRVEGGEESLFDAKEVAKRGLEL